MTQCHASAPRVASRDAADVCFHVDLLTRADVGNLSWQTQKEDLQQLFSTYGAVSLRALWLIRFATACGQLWQASGMRHMVKHA